MVNAKSKLKPAIPKQNPRSPVQHIRPLPKALTGIAGLDVITAGGLPRGRPTLVTGGAGCGKTLLALEFLLRGAVNYGEPGLFVAFEETEAELIQNAASLGFNLPELIARKKLLVEYIHVEHSEVEETGEYDLEGLFIRLGLAIDAIGARRVALDTLEVLFGGFSNMSILRNELRRLFHWLKRRGLTVILTAERGDGAFTRHGLEEYVSDCVILLDHRVIDQVSTRRIRIVKYRGSAHGTNEYPFLIGDRGIWVKPITAMGLGHPASSERVSSGVPALDEMLGGALTALKMDVSQALKDAELSEPTRLQLTEVVTLVDSTIISMRHLATELRPHLLDDFGLLPAMEAYFQDFIRRLGIAGQFTSQVSQLELTGDAATAYFRIFQESLTNIARHAKASQVTVRLERTGDSVQLHVTDNGGGMRPEDGAAHGHLGLSGMHERAGMIGAALELISAPGQGTTVLVRMPIGLPS